MILTNNLFFKPTPIYKEYMILDLIEKNAQVTQRQMSMSIGGSVSMINYYLDQYEEKGLIKRKKHSTKTVEYFVTKKGMERKQVLNISYLSASLDVYKSAKIDIVVFLKPFIDKGYKNILLYGAGEVAEILLQTILIDPEIPLNVLAVIDDDVKKQGIDLVNTKIIDANSIEEFKYDAILIASYTNKQIILQKLLNREIDIDKILQFFDPE